MAYHSYVFFDAESSIHSLSPANFSEAKKEFSDTLHNQTVVKFNAYAMLAFKAGMRFMIHGIAEDPKELQLLLRNLLHTKLGPHIRVSYTLFGLTRSSQYNPKHPPKEIDPNQEHQFLVVYPFTKTTDWHLIPYDERRSVMKSHVEVGLKHNEKVGQRLLYSYGIDDHEFIVSYYMNNLEDFVQLVMDMRETESRRHTKNDLPIFTCTHMPIEEALEML